MFVYLGELEELSEELFHRVEDQLIEVVNGTDDFQVRRRALESLGYSGRPEVPPLIRAAYEANTAPWLESALFAMSRSADSSWDPEVLRMLRHPEVKVQVEAIRAAGELELDAARRPLLLLLDDELLDSEVRAATYWSLSKIGGEEVREVLEARLEETEDEDDEMLLEDALENLDFTEEMHMFEMLDLEDLPEEDEPPEEYLARLRSPIVDEKGDRVPEEDDLLESGDSSQPKKDLSKPDSDRKRHRPKRSD
jgi:HEAT repeat protein